MRRSERRTALALAGACASFLPGCERLAMMLAPDPSDFVAALLDGAAAVRGRDAAAVNRWPPMTASPALVEGAVARPATARCAGLTDTAFLDCVVSLARVDDASRPVFESCSLRADGPRELDSCVEFALGLEADAARMGSCASGTDFDWHACSTRFARPKSGVPLQGRVLHALEAFRRAEEGKRSPVPPRAALLVARSAEASTEAEPAVLTRAGFDALCDAAFADDDKAECRTIGLEDPASNPPPAAARPSWGREDSETPRLVFEPTSEAFAACTRREGGRFLAREALTCLRHSASRRAASAEYATCENAFRPGHPGFLSYVRACAARAGFRLYTPEDSAALGEMLETALSKAGSSRARLLESYETLSVGVRKDTIPNDAF